MKKLYFISTNGYDMVVSDDGETRRALADSSSFAVCDHRDRAAAFLNEIEDDSSWEEWEETIEEIVQTHEGQDEVEIIAECERNDL